MNQLFLFAMGGAMLIRIAYIKLRQWGFWKHLSLRRWSHVQHAFGLFSVAFIMGYLAFAYVIDITHFIQQMTEKTSYISWYIPETVRLMFQSIRLSIYIIGLIGLIFGRHRLEYMSAFCYALGACLLTTPVLNILGLSLIAQGCWMLRPETDNG